MNHLYSLKKSCHEAMHSDRVEMISSETPYKLAEIIRDTWPQIFRPMKKENKKK